jgi:hypothetical protein
MFKQAIPVDWEQHSLEIITQTVIKKYCSLIHGQPILEAVLELKRRNGLTADNIEDVSCDVFQGAFDFAGVTAVASMLAARALKLPQTYWAPITTMLRRGVNDPGNRCCRTRRTCKDRDTSTKWI